MSTETAKPDFRALHYQDAPLLLPNPWDVGSAKMLAAIGFKALATTSGGFAWSIGKLDGAVSLEEKLQHCRDLCANVDIPVSADLGPGFGESPEQVEATVRAAGETGLAGCSIEDAANPYFGGAYDHALAVERVAAAVEAARSLPGDFVFGAKYSPLGIAISTHAWSGSKPMTPPAPTFFTRRASSTSIRLKPCAPSLISPSMYWWDSGRCPIPRRRLAKRASSASVSARTRRGSPMAR